MGVTNHKNTHIPIYYINLDRSTSRNENMLRQFKEFGVKSTRIPAVDADRGLQDYVIQKTFKCFFTNDKEYACTLSHLLAITTAYKNGDKTALIMEDDMKILRLPNSHLLSIAPADWDIIQLSASGRSTSKIYGNPKYYFIPWHQFYVNTGGYVINRRGMINLLAALAPDVLSKQDLHNITFRKTSFRWFPFPSMNACNADYIIYNLVKTYTCCDVSMYEDRSFLSTIQKPSKNNIQDRSARFISNLFKRRGFLMSW